MKMKIMKTFAALLLTVFFAPCAFGGNIVSVIGFGAVPDDGKDDTQALRSAAAYVRSHPGTTLRIPKGDYLLRDADAEALESRVLSGEYGQDPEKYMFTPYHKYVKGLDFTGAEDAVIDAKGARFLISGWMEPVCVSGCRNFKIKGLEFDYVRKPLSEGVVTEIGPDYFIVRFSVTPCEITEGTPFPRTTLWDKTYDSIYKDAFYFAREAVVGHNTVRFSGTLPERMLGAPVGALHTFHYRPAIFIHESDRVTLDGVTIRAHCGMGIVGFHAGNIYMRRMRIIPPEGQRFSTNTDATHFASCWGDIVFDHCLFRGQGDDATNVHGYYHDITYAEGSRAALELKAPTFTHSQLSDVPRIGDVMTLVRIKDLTPVQDLTVLKVWHEKEAVPFSVELDGALPDDFGNYYLINKTLMPHLVIRHCEDCNHVARGILVKTTGGTRIIGNTFRGLNSPGIVLSSENNWKEGWHTTNAVIKRNKIINCGGSGAYDGAGIAVNLICDDASVVKLHSDILIQGNKITSVNGNKCGVLINNATKVTVKGNKIKGCQEDVKSSVSDIVLK